MYDILDFVLLFVCIIALSIKIVLSDERISKLEEKDEYQAIYCKCPFADECKAIATKNVETIRYCVYTGDRTEEDK